MSAEAAAEVFREYHIRLEALYCLLADATHGLRRVVDLLAGNIANPNIPTHANSSFFYGDSDPDDPRATYVVRSTTIQVLQNCLPGGPHEKMLVRSLISFAYSIWEHEIRPRAAAELAIPLNNIASPVFADLRAYRQAIAHVNGRLDSQAEVMRFVERGNIVDLDRTQMTDLFDLLCVEVVRLAKQHCDIEIKAPFKKPIHGSKP